MPIIPAAVVQGLSPGEILKKYDKNGDGHLDKAELKQAFKHLGSIIPGWRAAWGLDYADANGDGVITPEEMKILIEYATKCGFKLK